MTTVSEGIITMRNRHGHPTHRMAIGWLAESRLEYEIRKAAALVTVAFPIASERVIVPGSAWMAAGGA